MKIKSKKIIQEITDVYDITVPEYHNFLIEQGIFVHNCVDHPREVTSGWSQENKGKVVQGSKDTTDACAQVIYSIFTNPIQTNIMDLVNSIQKSSITTQQAKPSNYNYNKRPINNQEAIKKALSIFNSN